MPERESLKAKELAQIANIEIASSIGRIQLKSAKLDLRGKQEAYDRDDASDYANRHYLFVDPINTQSILHCMSTLNTWSRQFPGESMEIMLHSPGGDVLAGLALFDHIHVLSQRHAITINTLGYAASMAGVILQAATHRVMGRESFVLIHEISSGAIGKIGEIEDTVKFVNKIQSRIMNIFISRSGGKIDEPTFISLWQRKDWWLSSDDMLRYGLVDEVR